MAATAPRVIDTVLEMAASLPTRRRAVVMTMGALHAGHAALIDHARRIVDEDGEVLVSIFVNPLQFGPDEDFARYPRTRSQDLRLCADHGVDAVFAPTADDLYSAGTDLTIDPGPMGEVLEGAVRPGHFRGMLTVVAKLLNLTRPDAAVYGEKDYQQLVLIRRLAAVLNVPVEIIGSATVREPDGLALSSRNAYLTPDQRRQAAVIPQATAAATEAAGNGATAGEVTAMAQAVIRDRAGLEPDYVALTDPELGGPPAQGQARLLLAVPVGPVRLIDNVPLWLEPR